MTQHVKILDRHRSESRARIGDIAAMGLLLVTGAALVFDMYTFGYFAANPSALGGVVGRDQRFVRMLAESFLAALSLAWIGVRLFVQSARRVGGQA